MNFKFNMHPCLRYKTYPNGTSESAKRGVRKACNTYVLEDQSLYKKDVKKGTKLKIVRTLEEMKKVLHNDHSAKTAAHRGIKKMIESIGLHYTWKGITIDIAEYVKTCSACQNFERVKTMAPELQPIAVKGKGDLLCMDLTKMIQSPSGNVQCLTITDHFTKHVRLYALPNKTAEGIASCLNDYICIFGAPRRILSDQGREFCNHTLDKLYETCGIKRSTTRPYHPQCNGQAERTNQTVSRKIAKLKDVEGWDKHLKAIEYAVNVDQQSSTGFSPFFLTFGHYPKEIAELELLANNEEVLRGEVTQEEYKNYVETKHEKIDQAYEKVQINQKKAQEQNKKSYRAKQLKGYKSYKFSPGDLVLKKFNKNNARKGGKLEVKWTGPYIVHELEPNGIRLKCQKGNILKQVVAHSQVKPIMNSSLHEQNYNVIDPDDPDLELDTEEQNLVDDDKIDISCNMCLLSDVTLSGGLCFSCNTFYHHECLQV